jgi:hypothetical protein
MGIACRKCTPDVRGLAWEAYVSYWSGLPLQVYIDLNRYDSWI